MKSILSNFLTLFLIIPFFGCSMEEEAGGTRVLELVLNRTTLSLIKGSSEILTATVQPSEARNYALKWSSSAPDVATVDENGWVTAISIGVAIITVGTEDGRKTATCSVWVTTSALPVSEVKIDKPTLHILVGSQETLTAIIHPENATNQNVTWSSSNPSVAAVNGNGMVTAFSEGSVAITAKTVDGNKTATCHVTVTSVSVLITTISLNTNTLNLCMGESKSLSATVLPTNTTNPTVMWSSSNHRVATVNDNGLVTALAEGNATITVRAAEGGIKADCNVVVRLFSGVGEANNPYLIGTAEQLAKLAELVNNPGTHETWTKRYYKLNANINLSSWLSRGGPGYNGGKGWIPIGKSDFPFEGNFDGRFYQVSELYISDNALNDAGLFGNVHNGTLSNLTVETAASGIKANVNVGVCAGSIQGNSSLTNCLTTGTVVGTMHVGGVVGAVKSTFGGVGANVVSCATSARAGNATEHSGGYVGGVAGWVYYGNITNCYALEEVSGNGAVGGVVGLLSNGRITNSYAKGAVRGTTTDAGGVVGTVFFGQIMNCYATGFVEGNEIVGGVAGLVNFGTVVHCYATGAVEGIGIVGGVVGWSSSSNIANCAALNPHITRSEGADTEFGRVAGRGKSDQLSNNVAWNGIRASNVSFINGKGHNHPNGADITAAQAKTTTFWTISTSTWSGRDVTVWEVTNNRLPILKNIGGNQLSGNPPAHIM